MPQYGVRALPPLHIKVSSPGDGGWGNPHERDPALVLRDVEDGVVSGAATRQHYAVVLAPDGRIELPATQALRRSLYRNLDNRVHDMSTSSHPRSHNQDTALGPRSRAEFERSKGVTPGGSMRAAPYFAPHPPYAVGGSGAWVTDVDGRRIFDCANNFFSLIHGHAFAPVVAALHDAIERGTAFGLPLTGESDLGEELRRRAPRLEQIRFTNSGTEAVMFAIKAARAITGRPAIAKIEGAYHGAYDHVEISLDPTPDNWGTDRPANVPYAKGTPTALAEDTLVLRFNEPQQCRELLQENAHRLAAVLLDPLASRAGMVPASAAFCEAIQESCRKLGILLIMDEVISFRLAHGGRTRLSVSSPTWWLWPRSSAAASRSAR